MMIKAVMAGSNLASVVNAVRGIKDGNVGKESLHAYC